jgi:WD40 repeat protein/tRNA A-37 threonylcarbamoyl transferase component Bud32
MLPEDGPEDAALEARLLNMLLEDRNSGVSRSIEEFYKLFPGQEAMVRRVVGECRLVKDEPHKPEGKALRAPAVLPQDGPGDPKRIGKYKVLHRIGAGGQAIVYLTHDSDLNREVAIKVLREFENPSPGELERFKREVEITAKLEHPGICPIYESGLEGGSPWVAMRYVRGENLREHIDRDEKPSAPKKVLECCHFIEQVARALAVAHGQGIVHRDIKPANIIVSPEGQPVVLDFGIARTHDSNLTADNVRPGTWAYMAPEQRDGEEEVDVRVDVWALGALLYEILTHERPVQVGGPEAAERTRRLNPAVSREVAAIIRKAMETDRDLRHHNAKELANALSELLAARRGPKPARLVRLAATLLVVALVGLFRGGLGPLDAVETVDQGPRFPASVRLVAQLGHTSPVISVAFSGKDDGWVLTASPDGTAILWNKEEAEELQRFEAGPGWLSSVAFSVSGERVLTGDQKGTAFLWDRSSGEKVRRFEGMGAPLSAFAFSEDDKWVLAGDEDGTVLLWDKDGTREEPTRSWKEHDGSVYSAALSEHGVWALTGGEDGTVFLWNKDKTRDFRRFEAGAGSVYSVALTKDGRWALTGHANGTAFLWDRDQPGNQAVRSFTGEAGSVHSVAFSPDGKWVLTGHESGKAFLWNRQNEGEPKKVLGEHTETVYSVAFSRDSTRVLTGSKDKTARLWSVVTQAHLRLYEGSTEQVDSVALSPDDDWLMLMGARSGTIRLWNMISGEGPQYLDTKKEFGDNHVQKDPVAFLRNGRPMPPGKHGGEVLLVTKTGEGIRCSVGPTGQVRSLSPSPKYLGGLWVSTDSRTGTTHLRYGVEGRPLPRFSAGVLSVAFYPDCGWVLTGGEDGFARLWDTKTGSALRSFLEPKQSKKPQGRRQEGGVSLVAFSWDGTRVLTGGWDGTAHLWETETGKHLRRFGEPYVEGGSSLASFGFSQDGKWVLTGGHDKIARLYRTGEDSKGKEEHCFEGHHGAVHSVAFSWDGRRVLTGSTDTTARLWETESGDELCQLVSFKDATWAVFDRVGRFDGSSARELQGLKFVAGREAIELSDLERQFRVPGLLKKVVDGDELKEVGPLPGVAPRAGS